MYALVDCNNFFVSCERAFQPELEGRPVVVLSNNDGCVVARSNESKAMGIKMGTPFFQVKGLVDEGKLVVRSSNYKLYGDLSARVMSLLSEVAPSIEVYSIDEAFMLMDGIEQKDLPSLCRDLVVKIRRWVGIPVSIGIANTKTLAKIANHFAKKYKGYKGVCLIDSEEKMDKALTLTPIDDIWGIGRRYAPKLMAQGVKTAKDFTQRPADWVQKRMGINGLRTWKELQGVRCAPEEKNQKRKSICTSRSFADMISDRTELSLRISDFAGMCAQKMRKEGTAAYLVGVFIHTNRFREDMEQDFPSSWVRLDVPVSSTQEVVKAALRAFDYIYRPELQYKRAGVMVSEIVDSDAVQGDLFDVEDEVRQREDKISKVMDLFNTSEGRNLVRLAVQRQGHYADGIRREHCSKLFSTDWDQLIDIK